MKKCGDCIHAELCERIAIEFIQEFSLDSTAYCKLFDDRTNYLEVVRGEWIDVRGIPSVNRKDVPVVKCSKCEIYFCDLINNHRYMYHYCPNCGAKMDGDGNV
jgi:hypothetical protein